MNILIDATNIVPDSGGFIHLKELLRNYKAKETEIIYVASSSNVNEKLKTNNKKVKYISNFFLNKGTFFRLFWQIFFINLCLKKNNCSKLFVLGGYFFFIKKIKVILLIQNILPLEKNIFFQDRLILIIKNYVLNILYRFSILRSDGIILLSKYSKKFLGKKKIHFKVIHHGIQNKFFRKFKKKQSTDKKFKILYVSKYEKYKNQLNLVKACYALKQQNINISLTLLGLHKEKYLLNSKLYRFIKKVNLKFKDLIIIKNFKKHKNLLNIYQKFDLHVYPSKCEAFGLIILETIASSLPIICSNYPVYKEILKKNTIYFDPDDPNDIANSIKIYITDFKTKLRNTQNLFKVSKKFNWKTSSMQTFKFIREL
jgi:glycosyltransferase involved in cell wall biosynthesis